MHKLLAGEEDFYDDIFHDLKIPHRPLQRPRRRAALGSPMREGENLERAAKVMQLHPRLPRARLPARRPRPAELRAANFPELEMSAYGLTIWDLDREFFSDGVTRQAVGDPARDPRDAARDLLRPRRRRVHAHRRPRAEASGCANAWRATATRTSCRGDRSCGCSTSLVEAEAFERFLHTRFVGHKRFSLEGGETLIPTLDALLDRRRRARRRAAR